MLAPLFWACLSGIIAAAFAPGGVTIIDGGWSKGKQDAARLLDSYAGPAGDNAPLTADEVDGPPLDDCGYAHSELDRLLDRNAALILMARATHNDGVIDRRLAMVDAIEQSTTGFGRGFLRACLQTPGYRALCMPTTKSIVEAARDRVTKDLRTMRTRNHAAMRQAICDYFDGERAHDVHAGFLPNRKP